MEIKVTEIKCNAEELRQSNTVSDGLVNLFRNVFNRATYTTYTEDEDEKEENENE